MRLLVLGGTGFVGRAVADEALARGYQVTVFNRGRNPAPAGVTALVGDRLAADGLAALDAGGWDAVVDTWSGDPAAVRSAAGSLKGRAGHYTYVSSRSVYAEGSPSPLTELSPVVEPDTEFAYAAQKRGGEIAAEQGFDGPVLLGRAGLILGPYEDVGRLPWWLNRLHRGGATLAPGPRDLPLQYVDARDLAGFLLDAAGRGLAGAYNLVSESGHATMGELLDTANEVTGGNAELRWTDPRVILNAGVEPWTDLPIWLPPGPDHEHLHYAEVTKARAAGLVCRPVRETVADTWAWLLSIGRTPPQRADRPTVGLDPAVEAALLASHQTNKI
jgi:nucleoside-diphosphate-sugar epimerase